jgi:hypothetical protein
MRWNGANKALRSALDLPPETLNGEHAPKIEALRHEYHVPDDLTCLPYAFELTNNPTYRVIASEFNREVFAGRKFAEWLLNNWLRELSDPTLGQLALYFSDKIWRHAGFVIAADRITSKWGTFPVYDHDFWEVPISYGNELRFFQRPSREDALPLFLDYCRYEDIADSDIAAILSETEET